MADRVIPIKIERITLGGSQDNIRYSAANVNEDGLAARALFVQKDSGSDSLVGITRDASGNNLQLFDSLSGQLNLSDLAVGQLKAIVEDFESATFPPSTQWTSPGDLQVGGASTVAWTRSAATPISGSYSAAVPSGTTNGSGGDGFMANNTRAYLQLNHFSSTWFRIAFKYSVVSETSNDYLCFYHEAVAQVTYSGGSSASPVAGTYYSSWFPPGHHRFVWFARTDVSYQVTGQRCSIDDVTIYTYDQGNSYPCFFDHFYWNMPYGKWFPVTTGSITANYTCQYTSGNEDGVLRLYPTHATNVGDVDFRGMFHISSSRRPVYEARFRLAQLTNVKYELGMRCSSNTTTNDYAYIRYDSAISANWRIVCNNGGTENVTTTSVAASTTQWQRLVIEVDKTAIRYYLNGVLIGTLTSSLPRSSNPMVPFIRAIMGIANVTPDIYVDYVSYKPTVGFMGVGT